MKNNFIAAITLSLYDKMSFHTVIKNSVILVMKKDLLNNEFCIFDILWVCSLEMRKEGHKLRDFIARRLKFDGN